MARVLVVETDVDALALMKRALEKAGHAVESAATAAEAIRRIRRDAPDLVVVEMGLVDGSGGEVCRRAKSLRDAIRCILLADAPAELAELGADDILVKPFAVGELTRRVGLLASPAAAPADAMVFGALRVHRAQRTIFVEGEPVQLRPLELKLLLTLIDRRPEAVSRRALLHEVWRVRPDLMTRTVDTHVRRLRSKLGVAARYIETDRGVGYVFVGPRGK